MKNRPYVGCKNGKREVFRSATSPTFVSHGHEYVAVIGPFRTILAAAFMAEHGQSNPHCRNVSEAERLAKQFRGT